MKEHAQLHLDNADGLVFASWNFGLSRTLRPSSGLVEGGLVAISATVRAVTPHIYDLLGQVIILTPPSSITQPQFHTTSFNL